MGKRHGKLQRQIGDRFERKIVKALNESGIEAERVPLSGAAGGSFSGDIVAVLKDPTWGFNAHNLTLELKKRADGFKQIYSWLEGNDALVIGADRKEPLIVLPLSEWIKQVGGE